MADLATRPELVDLLRRRDGAVDHPDGTSQVTSRGLARDAYAYWFGPRSDELVLLDGPDRCLIVINGRTIARRRAGEVIGCGRRGSFEGRVGRRRADDWRAVVTTPDQHQDDQHNLDQRRLGVSHAQQAA